MATQERQTIARWLVRAITVGLIAAVSFGCGNSPTAPRRDPPVPPPVPPTESAPLTVTAVSPSTGPAGGGTPVTLSGSGFVVGATVTIGGVTTRIMSVTSTRIMTTTGFHAAGVADVVVTNPDGRSASLADAFTYAVDQTLPPPVITSVSPSLGSTRGGTFIAIRGTGFRSGMAVILDGVRIPVNVYLEGTSVGLSTAAHAEGPVDIAVFNVDGQSATVGGGFTFAPPQTFDLDGDWEGGAGGHWEHPLQFTVRDNAIVSASCNGSPVPLSSPAAVDAGRFSVMAAGVVVMAGDFNTPAVGLGSVNTPLCPGTNWEASKKVGPTAAR